MKSALLAVVGFVASASASFVCAADRYVVKDQGIFASTGRFVEFADRYGWQSYEISFDFGFDADTKKLTKKSTLDLTVVRNDKSRWSYRCKGSKDELTSNINFIYGKGVSVLTECRIKPDKFSQAVGVDADMVGEPTLVFHVYIQDGKAEVGAQKGLYFLASGQIEASEMSQYATRNPDPSDLSVLFASETLLTQHHAYYPAVPRFVP